MGVYVYVYVCARMYVCVPTRGTDEQNKRGNTSLRYTEERAQHISDSSTSIGRCQRESYYREEDGLQCIFINIGDRSELEIPYLALNTLFTDAVYSFSPLTLAERRIRQRLFTGGALVLHYWWHCRRWSGDGKTNYTHSINCCLTKLLLASCKPRSRI